MDNEQSPARQETWLLSFIDILALLLTLFVLLLAYQDRGSVENGSEYAAGAETEVAPDFLSLLAASRAASESATAGFAMAGNGLVPLVVQADGTAVVETAAPADQPSVPLTEDYQEAVDTAPGTSEETTLTPVDSGPASRQAVLPATSANSPERPAAAVSAAPPAPVADERQAPLSSVAVADNGQPPEATRQAADELLQSLSDSALGERVEVTTRPGAVNLEISDNILFPPASATLSSAGQALLEQLAAILRTLPYTVSVEGHTDNVPIHTPQYPSNWELSSARAAMVTRKLIDQGVASGRLRAIGYGDTRPRADNTHAEGRAKNRRVTFVLQVEDQE